MELVQVIPNGARVRHYTLNRESHECQVKSMTDENGDKPGTYDLECGRWAFVDQLKDLTRPLIQNRPSY